jgi:hypothetical protein
MNGQPERRTVRNPGAPDDLPLKARLDGVLALNDFRDFSNQLQDIHDEIHGWVGGDMGSIGTSAFDPVFWAHHAMIDRAWYLWQLENGVNNIPPEYLDLALFPGLTVQQVLDVRGLGYDYAAASVAVGTDVPPGEEPSDAAEVPAEGGGPEEERETQPPTPGNKHTSEPLEVRDFDEGAKRIDIELHNVDHAGASYEGRIYVNNPDADENTGYEDESYAGSFHIFGHGGCLGDPGHCEVKERRPYDPRPAHQLTPAKKVVICDDQGRRAIATSDRCTITVVPVVEPLPYEDVDPKHIEEPLEIGYIRIVAYR